MTLSQTLNDTLKSDLVNSIDEQEWIDLTTEMVAIGQPNSTNPWTRTFQPARRKPTPCLWRANSKPWALK